MSSAAGSYGGGLRHLQRLENEQRTKSDTHISRRLCVVSARSRIPPLFPFPIPPVPDETAPTRSVSSAIKSALVRLMVMGYAGLRLL